MRVAACAYRRQQGLVGLWDPNFTNLVHAEGLRWDHRWATPWPLVSEALAEVNGGRHTIG